MNLSQLNQKVMKADYHGSLLSVVRSKCPSYIGVKGILLQETQNTLRLIDTDNKIRSKDVTIRTITVEPPNNGHVWTHLC